VIASLKVGKELHNYDVSSANWNKMQCTMFSCYYKIMLTSAASISRI